MFKLLWYNGMPEVRVELTRGCPHRILSPARLPFRHSGRVGENIVELPSAETIHARRCPGGP